MYICICCAKCRPEGAVYIVISTVYKIFYDLQVFQVLSDIWTEILTLWKLPLVVDVVDFVVVMVVVGVVVVVVVVVDVVVVDVVVGKPREIFT